MRRLGTLGDPEAARRFADALHGRGISTELRAEPGGSVTLWVLDEDRLADARAAWPTLAAGPEPGPPVASPPPVQAETAPDGQRDPRQSHPLWRRVSVTIALIAASIAATLWTDFGERRDAFARLAISSEVVRGDWSFGDHLRDLQRGQLWRLFTPALMHGDPIHLLGNLAALWVLGGAFESVRGPARMLVAVLVIATTSNYAEYWLDLGLTFDVEHGLRTSTGIRPDPFFLGMSGVVFGLFGLIWMRARFIPGSRFLMPRDLVVWMLIWLLACTAGLVGPIANVAHVAGLLTGMAIGIAPRLWHRG